MENVIWEGKASWKSGISVADIILTFITAGVWIIVPIVKIISLSAKNYKITDQRIIITEGILSRKENEVELFRVRDLSVKQGIMQKMFNVGDITVRSAEVSQSTLFIKGIENAYEIREQLRNSMLQSRKDNNVRISESY